MALLACALVTGGFANPGRQAHVDLYSSTVALRPDGSRVLVDPASQPVFLDGTRVLATGPGDASAAEDLARRQRAWLESGTVPGAGSPYEGMVRQALLDLNTLTDPRTGAVVAAWSPYWRYVWPRDSAFVAAALAETGHLEDAVRVLEFLQGVQEADGTFHARYLPDGSGVPDDRGIQLDGVGWALWAVDRVLSHTRDEAERRRTQARVQPLVDRSAAAALRLTDGDDRLPPVSADYWETREDTLTLGTVAPLLAGLEAVRRISTAAGDDVRARRYGTRAAEVAAAVTAGFGPDGYPRELGGRQRDTAVAFLLPPFGTAADPGVAPAFAFAAEEMRRPAGGLAPGVGWKRDGISWTPETAVFALVSAATGREEDAHRWLRWLNSSRTREGSLPEKVLHDGSPAAVAPLAWTAATVVLTVALLCGREAAPGTCPPVADDHAGARPSRGQPVRTRA